MHNINIYATTTNTSEMYEYKLYVLDRAQVITHVSQ